MKKGIPCKVCGVGVLKKRKRYRMSAIVVLIGYILLIPSIFGMAIGAVGLASTPGAVGGAAESIDAQAM